MFKKDTSYNSALTREKSTQKTTGVINRVFSFVESLRVSDRILYKIVILASIVSLAWLLVSVNSALLVRVPDRGGALTEGIIGTPRFVNPIIAVTPADRDLVSLVYSGIMKLGPEGTLVPDLAESLTISEDGLVYNIVLRENITFHDGTRLTTDDVVFTISQLQDPAIKSPLRASWEGIVLEHISDTEFNIVLSEPYAPFIENLTVGILPKHIWEFATAEQFPFSQHNSEPIGSGPYEIEKIVRNASGIPESYVLKPFEDFYTDVPKIASLRLHFYSNQSQLLEAFTQGEVDASAGLNKDTLADLETREVTYDTHTTPLPRTFALFFNQNEAPVFRDEAVRLALAEVVDREAIISQVFGGYGEAITSPIPPGFGVSVEKRGGTSSTTGSGLASFDEARDILRNAGWKVNEETGHWEKAIEDEATLVLSFSISTINTPEFGEIAELLKIQWESLGAIVDIKKFEQSDLTQSVIRPREYDTLLFGTDVGRELDFFSFWHSSQRNDPGLNVALYANITTDSILTEARTTNSFADREDAFIRFAQEIENETPAVFLFVPSFVYVVKPDVALVTLTGVAHPSERFSNISRWYIETESVWDIFEGN